VITLLGFASSLLFFFIGLLTFIGKLLGKISIPGYVMTVLLISLGQSIVLFSIGIIGGYVSRSFENSTNRPNYVIAEELEN
jgi:hypothetical protein